MAKGWTVYPFETLGSTQDKAKQFLAEGKYPLPFAIQADIQTAARGRSGNTWTSLQGNLFATLVVDVGKIPARYAGQYSFLTAVALMEILQDAGIEMARNKWPNDILVDGKKIAGILLESDLNADGTLNALMIGVGVNLACAPDGAVALADLTGKAHLPRDILNQFLKSMDGNLQVLQKEGFPPIRTKWLGRAFGIGTEIRVRLPRETFHAEFTGVDEDGALQVKCKDGQMRSIHSGDVFFEQKEKE